MNLVKQSAQLFTSSTLFLSFILIVVSAAVGLFLAGIFTILQIKKIPVIAGLVTIVVSFTRSVPSVLQLFLCFYLLPLVLNVFGFENQINSLSAAIIGLSFYHAGYVSEVIRAAYLAVDKGQWEAANSLGYTEIQSLKKVIVPQLIGIALPGWGNALIYLVHNSALVMYIGVMDVMAQAHVIMEGQYNQYQLEMYLVLALFYCSICVLIYLLITFCERQFGVSRFGYGLDLGIKGETHVRD